MRVNKLKRSFAYDLTRIGVVVSFGKYFDKSALVGGGAAGREAARW